MRLPVDARLPTDSIALVRHLSSLWSQLATQVNQLSEGFITARTSAYVTAPTAGPWNRGDFIVNSAPEELGAVASKYVIRGWVCTVSGTPGTWIQCRYLTGN